MRSIHIIPALLVSLLAPACSSSGGNLPYVSVEFYVLRPAAAPVVVAVSGMTGAESEQLFTAVLGERVFEVAQSGDSGTQGPWDYTDLTDRAVQVGTLRTQALFLAFDSDTGAQLNAAPGTSTIEWQEVSVNGLLSAQLSFPSATVQQAVNSLESADQGESQPLEAFWQLSGDRNGVPYSAEFSQQMTVVKAH